MKLRHLLPAALLALPFCGSAVPAYPGLFPHKLADGTTVNIRIHGDEYFNYITDEDGYLMVKTSAGLKYDVDNGARRLVTDEVLQTLRMQSPGMSRAAGNGAMNRMAALKNGRTTFCTQGDVHFLVLLVQYPDKKFVSADPKADMDAKLNQEGYNKYGAIGSMRDYFIATSGGKFRPTFDVSDVIDLDKPRAYYTGSGRHENVGELVKEAVAKADPKIDFSKYDYTGDGEVDAVIIYYAGYGQADSPDTEAIWPHQSSFTDYSAVEVDGKKMKVYCCFNELQGSSHYYSQDNQPAGIGTPVHEFCHVLGLPDLYDAATETSASNHVRSTPGAWDVMDSGPYNGSGWIPPTMSAYERWAMNWLEYEQIEDNKHYDLEALHKDGRALRINVMRKNGTANANEYFLVETRDRTGFDSQLPGEGLLIWHIDYDSFSWSYNQVNTQFYRPRCHIVTADGSANYTLNHNTTSSDKAAWPQDLTYLTPDTEITLNTNDINAQSPTGSSYIINMAYDKENAVGSFDYNTISGTPKDVTVLNAPARVLNSRGELSNTVRLSWQPVEGATGYMLSVWRVNAQGKKTFENRLDDANVGNVTYYDLPNFNATKMGLEYHATVRVVTSIPSSELSNEILFVANDVTEGVTSVAGIVSDDFEVRGLKGEIAAPEGAEIYTMSGVRTAATGLNAGIYLVRYNGKAVKVVVK